MKVLIIPGSLRPTSVGKKIIPYVEKALTSHDGVEVEVATNEDINLPLFDAPYVPAMGGGDVQYDSVKKWIDKVSAADAVVFLVPEYNGNVTPVQTNYIDWIGQEWNGKKASFVNYNSYDEKRSAEALQRAFKTLKIEEVEPAYLKFGEELDYSGEITDEESLVSKLDAMAAALVK